jgi:ParB-like chromosome segregation protein Spo0J
MTTTEPATLDATGQWLNELEIPFELVDPLDFGTIDEKASLRNQARFEAIDEDVVDRYVGDMERGDRFPPIIVRKRPRSATLVVLAGNHRVAAARKAGVTLSAYVIECTDEMAFRISVEDNRRHGLPPSDEERIAQATHLIALGWTQASAAACVGVSAGKIQRSQQSAAANQRAVELGVKGFEALPQSSRWRLAAIKSDPAFTAAAQLAVDAALTTTEVFDLVSQVQEARSDNAAVAHVDDQRRAALDRVQLKKSGRETSHMSTTPRTKLLRSLTEVTLLDPAAVASSTLPDQRQDLSKRIHRAIEHLLVVDKMLGGRR